MTTRLLGSNAADENKELRRLIAVLVQQMGGSASITTSDITGVENRDLSIETLIDPYMIRITVSEPRPPRPPSPMSDWPNPIGPVTDI